VEETRERLAPYLPGSPGADERYNFAICLRETGEVIGSGGSHKFVSAFGWPEIGYMLRSEYWGQGLAGEFLRAMLGVWEGLPREEVELDVDPRSVVYEEGEEGGHGRGAREVLIAVTEVENERSQQVLRKCGFEHFITWEEEVKEAAVGSNPSSGGSSGKLVKLPTFRYLLG